MKPDLGPPIPDRNLVAFVRGAGALALIGASVGLACSQIGYQNLAAFVSSNALSTAGATCC